LWQEADKAPTEIVVVLKGLLEDGQLILQDGRKIVSPKHFPGEDIVEDASTILMHPDFRLFVLVSSNNITLLDMSGRCLKLILMLILICVRRLGQPTRLPFSWK
jgi:hypothetical protein